MSRISSMARLEKGLIVRGTGYKSPIKPSAFVGSAALPKQKRLTIENGGGLRRYGSACCIAPSGSNNPNTNTNNDNKRPPFLSAGCNRKHSPNIGAGSKTKSATPTSAQSTIICRCQHPADISFLENLYVQNLQTQIEVLEMENNYLRGSGEFSQQKTEQQQQRKQQQEKQPIVVVRPKSILMNAGERNSSGPEMDATDKYDDDYRSRLTSSTKGMEETMESEDVDDQQQQRQQQRQKQQQQQQQGVRNGVPKRVEFAKGFRQDVEATSSKDANKPVVNDSNSYQMMRKSSQDRLGVDNNAVEKPRSTTKDYKRFQDEDLFLKLEKAFQNEMELEGKLKAQITENQEMRALNAEVEEKFYAYEEKWTRERRSLLEDNVELQRRLDALTPLVAEREARLLRLEDEHERGIARLRYAETQSSGLKAKLEEQKREELLLTELESDRRLELERLREKLKKIELELHEARHHVATSKDELLNLKQKLREKDELQAQEHAKLNALRLENSSMGAEKLELAQKFEKLSQLYEKSVADRKQLDIVEKQLRESKCVEKILRAELHTIDEQLERKSDANKLLKNQLKEFVASEAKHRDVRQHMLNELEALQALSLSLTNENKGLREERIAIDEHIHKIQKKVLAKEQDVADLTQRLNEFKRKYTDAIERLSEEIARQHDTSEELEEIVKRVQELSNAIPRRISRSPTLSPTKMMRSSAEQHQIGIKSAEDGNDTQNRNNDKEKSKKARARDSRTVGSEAATTTTIVVGFPTRSPTTTNLMQASITEENEDNSIDVSLKPENFFKQSPNDHNHRQPPSDESSISTILSEQNNFKLTKQKRLADVSYSLDNTIRRPSTSFATISIDETAEKRLIRRASDQITKGMKHEPRTRRRIPTFESSALDSNTVQQVSYDNESPAVDPSEPSSSNSSVVEALATDDGKRDDYYLKETIQTSEAATIKSYTRTHSIESPQSSAASPPSQSTSLLGESSLSQRYRKKNS